MICFYAQWWCCQVHSPLWSFLCTFIVSTGKWRSTGAVSTPLRTMFNMPDSWFYFELLWMCWSCRSSRGLTFHAAFHCQMQFFTWLLTKLLSQLLEKHWRFHHVSSGLFKINYTCATFPFAVACKISDMHSCLALLATCSDCHAACTQHAVPLSSHIAGKKKVQCDRNLESSRGLVLKPVRTKQLISFSSLLVNWAGVRLQTGFSWMFLLLCVVTLKPFCSSWNLQTTAGALSHTMS